MKHITSTKSNFRRIRSQKTNQARTAKIRRTGRYISCLFLAVLFFAASVPGLRAEISDVRFKSPKHDGIWIGKKKIELAFTGIKGIDIKSAQFYLDGRLIKELKQSPYSFIHNFGKVPKNRKLQVMVKLVNGQTIRRHIESYRLDDSQEVEVLQVVVGVAVQDRRGNYVSNLKKEDFILLEDGVEQDISSFSKSGKSKFHLVLLIDISASMKDKILKVKKVAKEFLRQLMGKNDEAMVVFFNHEVFEDSDFTSEIGELDNALSVAFPYGATAMYDAIAYSVKIMKSIIGHNIIILFSDGEDNSSAIDPYTLINMVERSNSVIYSIGKKNYMDGYDQYQQLLKKISVSSGGMTFFLDDVEEVQRIYGKIRQDIQAKFLLRFSPKDKKKRNRFRRIQVKLKKKRGYKIRTMKGYYY